LAYKYPRELYTLAGDIDIFYSEEEDKKLRDEYRKGKTEIKGKLSFEREAPFRAAILVVVANKERGMVVFNIAFIVVLLSIAIQGSLLPYFSKKLNMIDEDGDVLRTFNDYSDTEDVDFITAEIDETHKWVGRQVKNLELMPSVLLVLIIRNNENIIPNGNTVIEKGDRIVLCGSSFVEKDTRINLYESIVDKTSKYKDKSIRELDRNTLIVMIKRDEIAMIPDGNTTILENDILVLLDR